MYICPRPPTRGWLRGKCDQLRSLMLVRKATYTCEIEVISGSATNDPNILIQGSSAPTSVQEGLALETRAMAEL